MNTKSINIPGRHSINSFFYLGKAHRNSHQHFSLNPNLHQKVIKITEIGFQINISPKLQQSNFCIKRSAKNAMVFQELSKGSEEIFSSHGFLLVLKLKKVPHIALNVENLLLFSHSVLRQLLPTRPQPEVFQ